MTQATDGLLAEFIRTLPALLWVALAAAMLLAYREDIGGLLSRFARLGSFEAGGVKFTCASEAFDDALELAEKSPQWKVRVPPEDKRRALARASRHAAAFKGAQFLWVDDHPENNMNERRMFRQLDVDIDAVTDNDAALRCIETARYDLVLTDIGRDGQASDGLDLVKAVHERRPGLPVILYVGDFRPELGVPAYAFGVAHRPDQLLHLTLDVLDRKRDA